MYRWRPTWVQRAETTGRVVSQKTRQNIKNHHLRFQAPEPRVVVFMLIESRFFL